MDGYALTGGKLAGCRRTGLVHVGAETDLQPIVSKALCARNCRKIDLRHDERLSPASFSGTAVRNRRSGASQRKARNTEQPQNAVPCTIPKLHL